MSNTTHSCPKCEGRMEEGFILEQNLNHYVPNIWVEGPPEPSFWTLTKVFDKPKKLVSTFRCVACGFLESYANQAWTGKVGPS